MTSALLPSVALLLALAAAAEPMWAAAPAAPPPRTAGEPSKALPEKPDTNLLEFLADWQGDDGQWVDPMTFNRIDPSKVSARGTHSHAKPPVSPPAGRTGSPSQSSGSDTRSLR